MFEKICVGFVSFAVTFMFLVHCHSKDARMHKALDCHDKNYQAYSKKNPEAGEWSMQTEQQSFNECLTKVEGK